MFPELRGQYADYLLLQLELFRSGERAGTGYARIMNIVADNMTDDEMRAVAVYYSALQPQNEASRRYRNHRVANDGL